MAGIFTQIRPVWIDELESRPKNLWLGPYIFIFIAKFFLTMSATAHKKVVFDGFFIQFNMLRNMFTLFKRGFWLATSATALNI